MMDQMPHARILVADDHEHMRSLLRQCFENAGYEVDSVEDGALAVDHVQALKPDVVVLSVMGGGIDGEAVLAQLKECSGAPPVVVLAEEAADGADAAAPDGAAAILRQPFTFPVLLGVCEALVSPHA
jgi:CheY-like chemotaxis protein